MQAKKPYISTGLRDNFAIFSSQVSTMMEPGDAILEHETTNRRWEISPRDLSFLSSLSIIHDNKTRHKGSTRILFIHDRPNTQWTTLVARALVFNRPGCKSRMK